MSFKNVKFFEMLLNFSEHMLNFLRRMSDFVKFFKLNVDFFGRMLHFLVKYLLFLVKKWLFSWFFLEFSCILADMDPFERVQGQSSGYNVSYSGTYGHLGGTSR